MAASIPLPVVPIRDEDKALFKSINTFVHEYMSGPDHDNSHDYHHILRVLSNANRLLSAEQETKPSQTYDTCAVFLAALLHDVGDHKYVKPGEDAESQIANIMRERGASEELAVKVQTIVKHVGYTNENKNPESVVEVLARIPELAIVQDADRLDAIGAVGVGRCFAYGGARSQGLPMSTTIDHFEEKLYKLSDMMKTKAGKEAAESRKNILVEFANQFHEEAKLSFTLE
ncbi:hypothetical protein K504DRAFT_376474 [Pleomassaria siparia CBS 279.74]|uniref:HD/PDEase domain-containing protein n=1 Tax=Pleomassaria siparia CBS 279.74 TaxID=1314801 RepID=A0A6G1KFN7_9PLEO|nr:hypothetical protein K504DRAFT_376474 [Pleomassaria siparia CBS 279.74]